MFIVLAMELLNVDFRLRLMGGDLFFVLLVCVVIDLCLLEFILLFLEFIEDVVLDFLVGLIGLLELLVICDFFFLVEFIFFLLLEFCLNIKFIYNLKF